jgi:hypothetical protein
LSVCTRCRKLRLTLNTAPVFRPMILFFTCLMLAVKVPGQLVLVLPVQRLHRGELHLPQFHQGARAGGVDGPPRGQEQDGAKERHAYECPTERAGPSRAEKGGHGRAPDEIIK